MWIYIPYSCFFWRILLALIQINCLHSFCLSSNHSACSRESITATSPSLILCCIAIGPAVEREQAAKQRQAWARHKLLDSERQVYQHAERRAIEQSSNTHSLAHTTRLACYMWVGGRRMSRTWEGTKHAAKRPEQPRLPLLHAGCVFVAEMPSEPGMHAAAAGVS